MIREFLEWDYFELVPDYHNVGNGVNRLVFYCGYALSWRGLMWLVVLSLSAFAT